METENSASEPVMEKDVPVLEMPVAEDEPTKEQSEAMPEEKQEMAAPDGEISEPAPSEVSPSEQQSPEKVSDPVQASTPCLLNAVEPSVPETEPEKSADPQSETLEQLTLSEKPAHEVKPNPEGDASSEKPAETANIVPEEVQKEVKADVTESDPMAVAEIASVQTAAEPQKEEDAAPALGSLSFALLEREHTRKVLQSSQTLVVLQGLPGSGKSFLARAIAEAFKDQCFVISADDHGVVPENQTSCASGYRALDEAVVAQCSGKTAPLMIVVDDTNHTLDRLARLEEIAEQNRLLTIFLEPQTEWSRNPEELSKKSRRDLQAAQLQAMKLLLEEVTIPLFFGWFLLSSAQDKIKCSAMDFVKTLDTLEAFKKHSADFTGKAEKEVDLEQYFQAKGPLHCTTKFCNYGKAEGAKEYANNQVVKDLYGSVSDLSLIAFFVTPRTFGARVSLTEEQLQLWPADAESSVPAASSLPLGSRAHVTLGCAAGVEPVQTGLDLLDILVLQKEGQQGELVEEMELGSLSYYGEGRWMLTLREPNCALACFSSFYGPKEPEPVKPEKRKKPKCSIL